MRMVLLALGLAACTAKEPPGAIKAVESAPPKVTPAAASPSGPAVAAPVAPAPSALPASASAPDPATSAPGAAALDAGSLEADDGTLAQTEARPDPADPLTIARARALFDAFVADEPARGQVFFFPLDAYKQVKDSSNPESDWRGRLIAAYARDLHEIRRARPHLKDARFVGLEIPEGGPRWIKPGEEYNKIGYFRVFKSNLVYETAAGETKRIELKSLISWRGRFYLVHLSSFK